MLPSFVVLRSLEYTIETRRSAYNKTAPTARVGEPPTSPDSGGRPQNHALWESGPVIFAGLPPKTLLFACSPASIAKTHFREKVTMGLLDGVLGGVVGAEMATVVNGFITSHGGVQGIVAQMENQGFGNTVKSWVGSGANAPITPDQVHAAFGPEVIANIAAKFGMNPQELAQKLSQVLPQAIDHLTPTGTVKPA